MKKERRPKTCEFSDATKLEALRRADFTCECCGTRKKDTPEKYLECHHMLGIATALYRYPEISHAIISSVANCKIYCKSCHKKMDALDQKEHKKRAQELIDSVILRQLALSF